jgi:monofunctional biosynthetic peptidoglycan transglycosylase
MSNRTIWPRRLVRLFFLLVASWTALSLIAVAALRYIDPAITSVMLLEPGPVGAIEHRWVHKNEISIFVAQAAIAAEDQRFLDHHGLDFNALAVAIEDYRRGDSLRGASTITQQVAKNLFLWNGRSFLRKVLEAWFAVIIDLAWPKERTLEVYLNIAEFGPGIFGVEAAANRFFASSAADISRSQAATLAAVLPDPKSLDAGTPSDYIASRRSQILEQMRLLDERGHYRGLDW